jgi:hypothetical protein
MKSPIIEVHIVGGVLVIVTADGDKYELEIDGGPMGGPVIKQIEIAPRKANAA